MSDTSISLLAPFAISSFGSLILPLLLYAFSFEGSALLHAVSKEVVCPKRWMASESVQPSNRIQRSMMLQPLPSA